MISPDFEYNSHFFETTVSENGQALDSGDPFDVSEKLSGNVMRNLQTLQTELDDMDMMLAKLKSELVNIDNGLF